MNQLPEAAKELREAIRLQPDFAGAHTTLGSVLRKMGDTEAAAAESRAGAEISKQKNGLQSATFTTNSGRRLLEAGDSMEPSRNSVLLLTRNRITRQLTISLLLHFKEKEIPEGQEKSFRKLAS